MTSDTWPCIIDRWQTRFQKTGFGFCRPGLLSIKHCKYVQSHWCITFTLMVLLFWKNTDEQYVVNCRQLCEHHTSLNPDDICLFSASVVSGIYLSVTVDVSSVSLTYYFLLFVPPSMLVWPDRLSLALPSCSVLVTLLSMSSISPPSLYLDAIFIFFLSKSLLSLSLFLFWLLINTPNQVSFPSAPICFPSSVRLLCR